ncbi:MAG: ABC transporter permease, partial [Bifidobacteriaceae bacterium]|nr:ABC transporter permease [Bifidobacteriaceae bacterium]
LSFAVLAAVIAWAAIPALSAGALTQDIIAGAAPPGDGHPLGTDALGRDVWRLTMAGSRTALAGPITVAAGSMLFGLLLGLVAAYRGGLIDWIICRYVELMLSLPSLLLAIVAAGVIGGGYWISVVVLLILFSPYDIRLIRSAALARIHDPYLEAARLLGLSSARVIARHLFPGVRALVGANLFLNMGFALVSLSSLSFLGLGISPQQADWGRQLTDARTLLFANPVAAIAPGLAIISTAVALNLVGDWITERSGVGDE